MSIFRRVTPPFLVLVFVLMLVHVHVNENMFAVLDGALNGCGSTGDYTRFG